MLRKRKNLASCQLTSAISVCMVHWPSAPSLPFLHGTRGIVLRSGNSPYELWARYQEFSQEPLRPIRVVLPLERHSNAFDNVGTFAFFKSARSRSAIVLVADVDCGGNRSWVFRREPGSVLAHLRDTAPVRRILLSSGRTIGREPTEAMGRPSFSWAVRVCRQTFLFGRWSDFALATQLRSWRHPAAAARWPCLRI